MNKIYVKVPKKKFKINEAKKESYTVKINRITFYLDKEMFKRGADGSLHICLNENSFMPVEFMKKGRGKGTHTHYFPFVSFIKLIEKQANRPLLIYQEKQFIL